MTLTRIGGFSSTNGAEISAFDPSSDRLFVVAGSVIEILNLVNPAAPAKIADLPLSTATVPPGFSLAPNSLAVGKVGTLSEGIVAVALAVRDALGNQAPGQVQFFIAATGTFLGTVNVGFLPDMITFSPDGTKVLTANEGEPNESYTVDPVGSISIIDLSGGIIAATNQEASFVPFNAQQAALEASGVRIFGQVFDAAGAVVRDSTVAEDLEPEYITFSGDGTKAWVTLQENNAVAIVDIASATVESIVPLGFKNHNGVSVTDLETFQFRNLPSIGTADGKTLFLGGFSGLFFEGYAADGSLKFVTHTDRGPNGEATGSNRPFLLPNFSPEIVRFELNPTTGNLSITQRIALKQANGTTPITGLPNLTVAGGTGNTAYNDEIPVNLTNTPITPLDPFGGDFEGIVINPTDGTFWMVDEYRPAIYHFSATGTLIERYVPIGTGAAAGQAPGTFGTEVLPSVLAQRRQNRGFEAVALNTDNGKLYAFVQSPLRNPTTLTNGNLNALNNVRVVEFDVATETVTAQYIYRLDNPDLGTPDNTRPDKIGDAVYIGNGEFLLVERDDDAIDSDPLSNIEKKVYRFSIGNATNVNGQDGTFDVGGGVLKSIDQMTPAELTAAGFTAIRKTLHVDLATAGYNTVEKVEGLAFVDANTIAVLNDNDFRVGGITINPATGTFTPDPNPEPVVLGLITTNSNGLDASDRDGPSNAALPGNIRNWPVLGAYQPDAIASFTVGGQTYYVTANEGDARVRPTGNNILPAPNNTEGAIFNEEVRAGAGAYVLDPTAFPNAVTLKNNANLGRLTVTNRTGNTDGDGDFDQIVAYGARSFSIWNSTGTLVFDSGDDFEQILAANFPANLDDGRSDNKGPEPEGVTVGEVNGRFYAFIGLERSNGVMVYDVTNPNSPQFIEFLAVPGDVSPEGLTFIPAADSPNGENLLVVSNEVSNTVSVLTFTPPVFTLQLLHFSDQEAGIPAIADAPRLSAVLTALKNQDGADADTNPDYANTLILSSGDAYIPGTFLDASVQAFGGQGRADILIQNELGVQAIAFGNHEFDLGTSLVANLLRPSANGNYPGAAFPYLSGNLNFAPDTNLAPLVTADGQEAKTIPGRIAASTVITVNNERIGVVGATTPILRTISSPGNVGVLPTPFGGTPTAAELDALAAVIQADVDALLAANSDINKVILLAHMQQIAIERELATRLRNVDIIMAGGSNTRLLDANDRLRAGDTRQGDYPFFTTDANGQPIAVVNTDGNYKYVGRLVIDFDGNGNIVPGSYDVNVSGAYATDDAGVAALNAQNLIDPQIQSIVNQLSGVIAAQDGAIFGHTDVFLNGTRNDVRQQETNLGNLTADANLAIAKAVDSTTVLSLKNGGGIRNNIGFITFPPGSTNPADALRLPPAANPLANKAEGDISQLDITNSLSFNNGLTLVTVTAEQLLQVIEHSVAATTATSTPGQFAQIGGFKFSFDATRPAGDRVLSLAVVDDNENILDTVVENGAVVGNASRTFRMITLNFLANGGDSYPFPTFQAANPTLFNRVDLQGEPDSNNNGILEATEDLNGNGVRDAAITEPTALGKANFASFGSEQDALAEYLAQTFPNSSQPYTEADVGRDLDERIQNVAFRSDTVLVPGASQVGFDLDDSDEDAGIIALLGSLSLALNITNINTSSVNELVVFKVEDGDGSVRDASGNLITPGTAGFSQTAYLQAIINAATTEVILSTLDTDEDLPDAFQPDGLQADVDVDGTGRVGFLLVVNSTLEEVEANPSGETVFISTLGGAQITNLTATSFSLAFGDDAIGGFDDLEFNVVAEAQDDLLNEADEFLQIGRTIRVGGEFVEAIDLANLQFDFDNDGTADAIAGQNIAVQATLYREAAFNNLVGFYTVAVDGSVNGIAPTAANRQAYAQAAFNSRVGQVQAPSNESTATTTFTFEGGDLLLPFLISNASTPNGDFSNIYFPFLNVNADGADHIRLLGNGVFGFEDLPGGGDQDFDDVIVQVTTVNRA